MTTAQKTRVTCTRCGGDGQYHAPTSLPGGCFACCGTGYFMVEPKTVARREARERKADIQAADLRAISAQVTDRLLAAWGDEFAHIDEDYRHMHVTQKAQRILFQQHRINVKGTWNMIQHLDLLGV